jgi:hypothetical protein
MNHGIILGFGLVYDRESQQRGQGPVSGHPGNRLRFGRRRITGQNLQPPLRNPLQAQIFEPQVSKLLKTQQGLHHAGGADVDRRFSQLIQSRSGRRFGNGSKDCNRCRCPRCGACARIFQSRPAARSLIRPIKRANVVTPGNKILRSVIRAVAKSNRTMGRSALSQARV